MHESYIIKTPIASKWFILGNSSFNKSFLKLKIDRNWCLKRPNQTKNDDFKIFYCQTNLRGTFSVRRLNI